ncbi:MAG TPA: NUDIX domain-containing protein [Solirubrobacteraceae bacterium]|nr:NUDIX domain-containing protein [Solirubrobacteraceae bacterium]
MSATLTVRRWGYRIAYRLLQVFWFVARPHKRGVKCLVTDRDRILLVRHTYGRRAWDLPGGSMKRRESPLGAAHREMSEELGLDGVDWADMGQLRGRLDHRRDVIHCFCVELSAPALILDRGELETAQWFARDQLPEDIAPYVGEIIAHAPAPSA